MTARGADAVAAVVVDYHAGSALRDCVSSLRAEGVEEIVVVENGDAAAGREALQGDRVDFVVPGRNLGYGAGANRGIAATRAELVLVANADLRFHRGSVTRLADALTEEPTWAVVGPRLVNAEGVVYPSVRQFPSLIDAAGHVALALFKPDNPFSRRYRPPEAGGEERGTADWVSGACFLARRQALEELGGFDESFFMFAEEMDLCWRAHAAGWEVGAEPAAVVTHLEGVSRRRHPYRMLLEHHRSALRFASRTNTGWRRLVVPLAAVGLGLRLLVALGAEALRR